MKGSSPTRPVLLATNARGQGQRCSDPLQHTALPPSSTDLDLLSAPHLPASCWALAHKGASVPGLWTGMQHVYQQQEKSLQAKNLTKVIFKSQTYWLYALEICWISLQDADMQSKLMEISHIRNVMIFIVVLQLINIAHTWESRVKKFRVSRLFP